jgi:hypothetical protein
MSLDISDVGPTPASFQGSTPVRSGSGRILSLAMASDNQRAYAGSYAGVWCSDDGGRSWRQMSRPQPGVYDADTPGALYAPHIFDVAVSPSDPDIVLAAAWRSQFKPSRNGVYRSVDDERKLTVWEIRHIIRKVDEYYSANAKVVPVVQVVHGILKVSAAPPLPG